MRLLKSIIILFIVCFASTSTAQQVYTGGTCSRPVASDQNWASNANYINVYIQDDFANSLQNCTQFQDNTITEFQAQTVLRDMMEIWNSEARGVFLFYNGTFNNPEAPSSTSYDPNLIQICNNPSIEKPAIVVRFRSGCDDNFGLNNQCGSAVASVRSAPGGTSTSCDEVVFLTIYGENNGTHAGTPITNNQCITASLDWHLGPGPPIGAFNPTNLRNVLTHELGHALGLGHSNECSYFNNCPNGAGPTGNAIMAVPGNNANPPFSPAPARHLTTWDKNCVDDYWLPRVSTPYYYGFKQDGSRFLDPNTGQPNDPILFYEYNMFGYPFNFIRTAKGSLTGNSWPTDAVDNQGKYAYSMVGITNGVSPIDSNAAYADIKSSGSFYDPLYQQNIDENGNFLFEYYGSPIEDFQLDTHPVMTTTGHPNWNKRVIYTNASQFGVEIDPPNVLLSDSQSDYADRMIQLLNAAGAINGNPEQSCQNFTPRPGGFPAQVRSWVPVVSTQDPVSGNIVTAVVNPNEQIVLYASLGDNNLPNSASNCLINPSNLSNQSITMPVFPGNLFNYDRLTRFAPAISCQEDVPTSFDGHNCMLAWVDRGVPEGHVLVTYFSIQNAFAGGGPILVPQVDWHDTVYKVVETSALGHLSGGSFANRFVIGYKSNSSYVRPSYVSNLLNSPSDWTLPTAINMVRGNHAPIIVDPPSWGTAGNDEEAILMWTQIGYNPLNQGQ